MAAGELNLNQRAMAVADELVAEADSCGVGVVNVGGARVIDAGVVHPGNIAAGVQMARMCLADYAEVSLDKASLAERAMTFVQVVVHTNVVAACMASQYAGWQIKVDDYFAMGSGPMRAAYGKEALFNDIGHTEQSVVAIGVLETSKLPTPAVVEYICERCRVEPVNLTLAVAPTASIAGGVQVVARSVETALHKLHELKFDLSRIDDGAGRAPLPPVANDDMTAIGRTNDAVLYGAQVVLHVFGNDESIEQVGKQLPACTSRDYGRPFAEIFKRYDHDFYKIDPMLFSPARIDIHNRDTGTVHVFGDFNNAVILESFFG